jgi:hypothetical protein
MNMCALLIRLVFVLCQVSDRAHLVFDFHQAVDGLQVVKYYCILDLLAGSVSNPDSLIPDPDPVF